jgi:menaquinone-dependent protoporphyrinogen oxidase
MRVLVAYATKHGATQAIAERIAKTLSAEGHSADVRVLPIGTGLEDYEACVIGSAVYMGHWRKDATAFVRDHRASLARTPVWLFSSGPLGSATTDAKGNDLRSAAVPKEAPELEEMVHPREHHVFFGALDPKQLTVAERTLRKMPAARAIMPEGDFRDWAEIDGWAKEVALELADDAPGQA